MKLQARQGYTVRTYEKKFQINKYFKKAQKVSAETGKVTDQARHGSTWEADVSGSLGIEVSSIPPVHAHGTKTYMQAKHYTKLFKQSFKN